MRTHTILTLTAAFLTASVPARPIALAGNTIAIENCTEVNCPSNEPPSDGNHSVTRRGNPRMKFDPKNSRLRGTLTPSLASGKRISRNPKKAGRPII